MMSRPSFADYLLHGCRHFPDKTAVTIDERALTYGKLAEMVDDVSRMLSAHVGKGDRVAIWLPNSFAWIATFLAVTARGAISVPVNTRLTAAELAVILRDCDASMIVTTDSYRGRNYFEEARSTVRDCIVVDASDAEPPTDWRVLAPASGRPPRSRPERDDLFCIQYTSGTTSTPKGVMLTEQMYLVTAAYCAHAMMLTPSSQFMSSAPFFHCSGSMHAIATCLVAGCTLHSMSIWDPEVFLSLVRDYRGDSSHGIHLRDIGALGSAKARPFLAPMKIAAATGAPKDMLFYEEELGIGAVANLYGMTEQCGNFTMWFPDDSRERRWNGNGRPQAGNAVRVATEDGRICAAGEGGEIQMRGPTVTPGYFRRAEATRAAFTPDGWFRSGDLGVLNDDGELSYVGRLKEIIRVGGENVSPLEVEEALREVSGLRHVCVLSVPDERLGEVAAAVVLEEAGIDWPSTLRTIKGQLAGFKIPREIYAVDFLPVTATNKVQRSVLQERIRRRELRRLA